MIKSFLKETLPVPAEARKRLTAHLRAQGAELIEFLSLGESEEMTQVILEGQARVLPPELPDSKLGGAPGLC